MLTNAYLAALVRSGAARYFLLGGNAGFGPGGSSNAAVTTISSTCRVVTARRWAGSSWSARATLYDCAGKAAALAHPAG